MSMCLSFCLIYAVIKQYNEMYISTADNKTWMFELVKQNYHK